MSVKFTVTKHLDDEQTTTSIGFLFKQFIDQDDIESIFQQLFECFPALTIIEKSIGADRESIRFEWQNTPFELNVECYSQSVWVEPKYSEDTAYLNALFQYLQANN